MPVFIFDRDGIHAVLQLPDRLGELHVKAEKVADETVSQDMNAKVNRVSRIRFCGAIKLDFSTAEILVHVVKRIGKHQINGAAEGNTVELNCVLQVRYWNAIYLKLRYQCFIRSGN